jgi:hypothetical protein
MPLRLCFWLGLAMAAAGVLWAFWPTPGIDSRFHPWISRQTYGRRGPRVLIDEAHWNTHTAGGRYRPFAQLIARDGYRVSRNRQQIIPELLELYDILVIANPRGFHGLRFRGPAFTPAEVSAIRAWVEEGGGLLLAADAAVSVEAARAIASRYGVRFEDAAAQSGPPVLLRGAALSAHPIHCGRPGLPEEVDSVLSFPGPIPRGPAEAVPFAGGRGLALESGKGRVAVIADAGALTALLVDGRPSGINTRGAGNRQLALNILHWLSRVI